MNRECIERQLAEVEALAAIFPEELSVDDTILLKLQDFINTAEGHCEEMPLLRFTVALEPLAQLDSRSLKFHPTTVNIEFPRLYPESDRPVVSQIGGGSLTTEQNKLVNQCFEENEGEETVWQLIQLLNEKIVLGNASAIDSHRKAREMEEKLKGKELEKRRQESIFEANQKDKIAKEKSLTVPVLGRRIIYSPYIVKPAKQKDIKRCAEELKLGGYAKIGKPGVIVIEGPEHACQKYVPMLQDLGWKYQEVKGEQQEQGASYFHL
jgi:hypothetical protein